MASLAVAALIKLRLSTSLFEGWCGLSRCSSLRRVSIQAANQGNSVASLAAAALVKLQLEPFSSRGGMACLAAAAYARVSLQAANQGSGVACIIVVAHVGVESISPLREWCSQPRCRSSRQASTSTVLFKGWCSLHRCSNSHSKTWISQ